MSRRLPPSTLFPYTTLFRSAASLPPAFAGVDIEAWSSLSPEDLLLRSEEHTSELQSRFELVCRLLLEKKKPYRAPRAGRSALFFDARSRPPRARAHRSRCDQ